MITQDKIEQLIEIIGADDMHFGSYMIMFNKVKVREAIETYSRELRNEVIEECKECIKNQSDTWGKMRKEEGRDFGQKMSLVQAAIVGKLISEELLDQLKQKG